MAPSIYSRRVSRSGAYHGKLSEPTRPLGPKSVPDRPYLAQRDADGRGGANSLMRRLSPRCGASAAALLRRGLSAELTVRHFVRQRYRTRLDSLSARCMSAFPMHPISPAYSLMSNDFGKLRTIIGLLTPGLVFASDGGPFARAIYETVPDEDARARHTPQSAGRSARPRCSLICLVPKMQAAVAAAHRARVGRDTIAKFLFTSGSTGNPKAVINTHTHALLSTRRWAAGCTRFAFVKDEPPIVGRLVARGATRSAATTISIWCWTYGGTLYIDDGNPTPPGVPKSGEKPARDRANRSTSTKFPKATRR